MGESGDMSEIDNLQQRAARLRQSIPSHMQLLPQVREAVAIIEGLIKLIGGAKDAAPTK